ncbi:YkvA family protein [Stutzerimonas stutzeri]|uniref:YkvA family protein n=1 Tax=Stutzerimonas stutzeri TaxID=316 RepID=UPI003B76A93E
MKAPWNFMRYFPLAQRLIRMGKIPALLLAVARKSSSKRGLMKGLGEDLGLFQALCVAWWRGEYRAISPQALVAVVAGLLYFLSPIDAIPDWLPGIGFIDDLAVLGWVMRKWSAELEAFRAWKDAQPRERQTELQRLPELTEPKAGGDSA